MKGTKRILELNPHSPNSPYLYKDNKVYRNDLRAGIYHGAWYYPVPFRDSPLHPRYDSIAQLFSTVNPNANNSTPKCARNDEMSRDGLFNNSTGIIIYCNNWWRILYMPMWIREYMKLCVYWMCVVRREGCFWQKQI